MAINLPKKCLRGMEGCQPLAQIISDDKESFICCGLNDGSTRSVESDVFTHCWHNLDIDEMSDWNEFDIADTISVLSTALSIKQHMDVE